jgi:large subunit ribosomal protein L25
MKLKMFKRTGTKRSNLGEIRREGNIPAVLYSAGEANENISVDGVEFKAILRKITAGRLSTTRFSLVGEDKEIPAIVKDIQYHPTTYQVLHMDFMVPKNTVRVRVPIECQGVQDCQGVKLGGFLRPVMRYVKVECPADKVPEALFVDVRQLAIGQSKRLSDLTFPEGVKPLVEQSQVIVVIAKR